MKINGGQLLLALTLFLTGLLLLSCKDKGTEPQDDLDVTNGNPHCGLVAGFVRNPGGTGLGGVEVSISPVAQAQPQGGQKRTSLSGFMNYPNPFVSDTYLTYFLGSEGATMVSISIYDLQQELLRNFPDAPTATGANKLLFDGLDEEGESLLNGLYPCEILVASSGNTDSTRIALSRGVNISNQGGMQSYTVTTQSDGKYVIADVPLNIFLRTTNVVAPQDTINHPENWPFIETSWELTDLFQISASQTGLPVARDTVTLPPGGVTRVDFTLR